MKVFVAGASGALGAQLVPKLVAAGHQVVAMTKTPSKQDGLRELEGRRAGRRGTRSILTPSRRWWPRRSRR